MAALHVQRDDHAGPGRRGRAGVAGDAGLGVAYVGWCEFCGCIRWLAWVGPSALVIRPHTKGNTTRSARRLDSFRCVSPYAAAGPRFIAVAAPMDEMKLILLREDLL